MNVGNNNNNNNNNRIIRNDGNNIVMAIAEGRRQSVALAYINLEIPCKIFTITTSLQNA